MNARKASLIACVLAFGVSGLAKADAVSDLKANMDSLQRQLDAVKAQLEAVTGQLQKQKQEQEQEKRATAPFIQEKPGDALTILAPGGGEVTLYGHLDVSFDYLTKGLNSDYGANGGMPLGKMGWQ